MNNETLSRRIDRFLDKMEEKAEAARAKRKYQKYDDLPVWLRKLFRVIAYLSSVLFLLMIAGSLKYTDNGINLIFLSVCFLFCLPFFTDWLQRVNKTKWRDHTVAGVVIVSMFGFLFTIPESQRVKDSPPPTSTTATRYIGPSVYGFAHSFSKDPETRWKWLTYSFDFSNTDAVEASFFAVYKATGDFPIYCKFGSQLFNNPLEKAGSWIYLKPSIALENCQQTFADFRSSNPGSQFSDTHQVKVYINPVTLANEYTGKYDDDFRKRSNEVPGFYYYTQTIPF